MTLTLDLDKTQAGVLENLLDTSLRTLMLQEAMLNDEREKPDVTVEQLKNINSFLLQNVMPQRAIAAEILFNLRKASESRIVVPS